jgi:hypothetical protein
MPEMASRWDSATEKRSALRRIMVQKFPTDDASANPVLDKSSLSTNLSTI